MGTDVIGLIILFILLFLYATPYIPSPIVAILGAVAFMFLGAITPAQVFSNYANDTLLLALAVMIMGASLFEVGFSGWAGKKILTLFGGNEKITIIGLLIIAAVASAFLSNATVVAMFIPIIAAVSAASGGKIQQKYMIMPLAALSTMGGNLTLVGSTHQLTANAILQGMDHPARINMLTMTPIGIASVIIALLYFVTIGDKIMRKVLADMPDVGSDQVVVDESAGAGIGREVDIKKMTIAGVIFFVTVIGFMSQIWTTGFCAILGGCACILTGCIPMKRALRVVDWGAFIIMGGAMAMGTGINNAGTGKMVADFLIALCGGESAQPFVLLAVVCFIAALLTQIMLNLAVITMLLPIGLSLAAATGVDPMSFIIGIVVSAAAAFATPIGTTVMTMTMYAGYKFTDYTKIGGILNILYVALIVFLMPIIYPF